MKVTTEEHLAIKKKAKQSGMSITQLCKYLLLNSQIKILIEQK